MAFRFDHFNFNILDLKRSMDFYEKALGLKEVWRSEHRDRTYIFLGDGSTFFTLELTYIKNRTTPYDLGERDFHHLAMKTDDYEGSYAFHRSLGCLYSGDTTKDEYLITDPDGYIIEICRQK